MLRHSKTRSINLVKMAAKTPLSFEQARRAACALASPASGDRMPIVRKHRGPPSAFMTVRLWAALAVAFAPGALALNDGERFQDWTARCEKPDDKRPQRCFIFQVIKDKKSDQPLLQMAVGYLPENNQPAAIYTVPLGVALIKGISIKIDNQELGRVAYETCIQGGCIAGFLLTPERLEAFKRGSKSQLTLYDATGKAIDLEISLKGFTAGLNALR